MTASAALRILWGGIRLPVVALLELLEPIVRTILAAAALLVLLTALFFKAAAPPGISFPFWGMLASAFGCLLLTALYSAALRFLSA
jgi:hypothetical protein